MDTKLPLVLYGAGVNAPAEMAVVIRRGLRPVCFCDRDENKHGTTLLGLPVLTLTQVRERWKEANYWITVGPVIKPKIVEYLTKNNEISPKYILNYEEFEVYKGCSMLETNLMIGQEVIRPCCRLDGQSGKTPYVHWDCNGDMDSAISSFVLMRDNLIRAIRDGKSSICRDCPQIVVENYSLDKEIKSLAFGFDSPCQLSCIYCGRRNAVNKKNIRKKIDRIIRLFDYRAFLGILENRGLISENALIGWASGEISIDPRKQEILDAFDQYRFHVLTNAVIFDDALAEFGSRLGNSMNVSVDAGTREAYKKIKGMDVFDRVWGNIEKYIKRGVKVDLKYIFLPENSNDENVENFINKAFHVGVATVFLSANIVKTVPHSDEQIRLMAKMYRLAENNGMTPVIMRGEIPSDDVVKIHQKLEKERE